MTVLLTFRVSVWLVEFALTPAFLRWWAWWAGSKGPASFWRAWVLHHRFPRIALLSLNYAYSYSEKLPQAASLVIHCPPCSVTGLGREGMALWSGNRVMTDEGQAGARRWIDSSFQDRWVRSTRTEDCRKFCRDKGGQVGCCLARVSLSSTSYFIPLSHNGSCPSVCEPFTMHVKNPIFLNLSLSSLSLAWHSTEKQTRPGMSAICFQASLLAFLGVSAFYTLGVIMSFMS